MQVLEIEEKAVATPDKAQSIQITDDEAYRKAGELTLTLRSIKKEIDETFDPIVKKAHEAHEEAVSQKKKIMEPVERAMRILDGKISLYHEERQRQKREEEERLRKEAEEKARIEEEERRLSEAVQLEKEGHTELADAILEAPIVPQPVFVPKAEIQTPKVDGISVAKIYKAEVTSLPQLLQAISQGKAPITLVEVNQSALNGMARALREGFVIPGCKLVIESSVRGRS